MMNVNYNGKTVKEEQIDDFFRKLLDEQFGKMDMWEIDECVKTLWLLHARD